MKLDCFQVARLILLTTTAHLVAASESPLHGQIHALPGILYQSPVPQAEYILPQTTVIIRPAGIIDTSLLSNPTLFHVEGSGSGLHSGEVILSDDRQTIIFKPYTPFAPGERVFVNVDLGQLTHTVRNDDSTSFSFFISNGGVIIPRGSSLFPEEDLTAPGTTSDTEQFNPPSSLPAPTRADTLPLDFPYVSTFLNGETSDGNIFLANIRFSGSFVPYLLVLDNQGNPVFYRRMTAACYDFKLHPNGLMTYFSTPPSRFYAMDQTCSIVDSFMCRNGYPTDVHDIQLLENGHVLLMSYDPQVVDMSAIVPGGRQAALVYGLILQELDLNKEVVFQWRSWDYVSILDATHEDFTAASIDYVHGNALQLDTDGHILVSCRHMDEIMKISRLTGEILWRWGGKNNQFTFFNDTLGFSHQHAIRRIENGHLTLFDNGNFHSFVVSRALEYALDEQNKTATLVWEYRDSTNIYGGAMGYVQRLSNGNTLVSWGATNPTVTEVRPDGSKVFEMTLDQGMFSYRAYRFPFNAGNSAPQEVPKSFSLYQNYPNPFNGSTTFIVDLPEASVLTFKVYNILGQEVLTIMENVHRNAGIYTHTINLSSLPSGVYFFRLSNGKLAETRKVLLVK